MWAAGGAGAGALLPVRARPEPPAFSLAPQVHIKMMPAATYRLLTGQEQPVYL